MHKENDKILVGKITSTHGVKGCVKVMSFCENPSDLDQYQPLFNAKNDELKIFNLGL